MRPVRRFIAVTALAAATCVPVATANAATSPRGWAMNAVRFEPVDPQQPALEIAGVGTYRGAVEVRRAGGGLAVVNDASLDDYVRGISEVPASWPAEALKAQAIAARTYALWQRASRNNSEWRRAGADICATQACQVYRGVAREQQEHGHAWVRAADETRGQVILWRGLLIPAYYSSSNGGHTVGGGVPWLPAVPDPDDAMSPLHRWRNVVPLQEVARVFAVPGELFDAGRAGDAIVLTSRLPDGTQWQRAVPAGEFRTQLNAAQPAPPQLPKALPSLRFTAYTSPEGIVMEGRGWGHGLGLSQYGALGKARRGLRAHDIIAAYYGGLRPVTLPPEHLPISVRVAVALGRPRVAVTGGGRYRVVDERGQLLSPLASGSWEIVPTGDGVRVLPPPGGEAGLDLSAQLDAQSMRLRLSVPAIVSINSAVFGVALVGPQVLDAGEVAIPVPPNVGRVVVHADAGAGRMVTAEVSPSAAPVMRRSPIPKVTARPGSNSSVATPGAFAFGLWLVVAAALVVALARAKRPAILGP